MIQITPNINIMCHIGGRGLINRNIRNNLIMMKKQLFEHITENIEISFINKKQSPSLIVLMTTHERQTQTLFTLKSYNKNAILNNTNFQIILVDDSSNKMDFNEYDNLEIVYIFIKSKSWLNPCINYNLGIPHIKSYNLILTNAETCIFGNI